MIMLWFPNPRCQVEPGATVQMECRFSELSGNSRVISEIDRILFCSDQFPHWISWRKLDKLNSVISAGQEVTNPEYARSLTWNTNQPFPRQEETC